MKKQLLYTAALLLWVTSAFAQTMSRPDPNSMTSYSWDLRNIEVRDSSYLAATYDYSYIYDVDNRDKVRSGNLNLLIGEQWSRSFFERCEAVDLCNSIHIIQNLGEAPSDHYQGAIPGIFYLGTEQLYTINDYGFNLEQSEAKSGLGVMPEGFERRNEIMNRGGDKTLNGEVWIEIKSKTLSERFHDYKTPSVRNKVYSGGVIEYHEELPSFEWEITGDTLTVNSYLCHRAEADFRGRRWIAWFAPEIPVSSGPWKFSGLPGLIMQVEDTAGEYRWINTSITQAKLPILFNGASGTRTMSRKQIMKLFRFMYTSPYSFIKSENGYSRLGVTTRVNGETVELNDSNWTIPYNPIELE